MSSLIKGLARDVAEPLEQLGARFLRQGALFIFGVFCLLVSLVFLTVALNAFLQTRAGTEIAALSIGGAYLSLAFILLAVVGVAMRDAPDSGQETTVPSRVEATGGETAPMQSNDPSEFTRQIDGIVEPILGVLHDAGLRRERAALAAGAAIARELKPLTGVAFALVTGFILGRKLHERP
jgi:Putative Actinobacterial Holin-X, holin superfamily III